MAELRWGSATDTGRVRTENEDNLFAGSTLFVVADGMGGHQAGEIASQLTVDRLESGLTADTPTLADLVGRSARPTATSSMRRSPTPSSRGWAPRSRRWP